MIFYKDKPLTEVNRLAHHLVLATVLAAPIVSQATLQAPNRPASIQALQKPSPSRTTASQRHNRPYLAMVGPAALTFAEAEQPLPPEPVMPVPPKPKPDPTTLKPETTTTADPVAAQTTKPEKPLVDPGSTPTDNGPKPISILPDDTRREIRPEDVLPFFQFPGSSAGDNVPSVIINPAPATAPPSTATYRQQ